MINYWFYGVRKKYLTKELHFSLFKNLSWFQQFFFFIFNSSDINASSDFYPQEMYADHDNNIRNDKNSSLDYALPKDRYTLYQISHRMSPPISQSQTIFICPKSFFAQFSHDGLISSGNYTVASIACVFAGSLQKKRCETIPNNAIRDLFYR